ncbi:MAG: hypothetical protein JWO62_2170 [Acidimicrobiaceae bacterium]|jgi:hypothetical protein|nr:hypothetical protein [Acidimicrobiaceae bacterium]
MAHPFARGRTCARPGTNISIRGQEVATNSATSGDRSSPAPVVALRALMCRFSGPGRPRFLRGTVRPSCAVDHYGRGQSDRELARRTSSPPAD